MPLEYSSDIPLFVLVQLKSIAEKLNFVDFAIGKQCARDGFLGSLSRYKIFGKRKRNDEIISDTISLICKTLPANESRIRMFDNIKAFEREVYFYNKIKPILENFQKDRLANVSEDGFVAYPKCYVAERIHDQYIILLDDLICSGYQTWNRAHTINIETVSLVMKELGKFHALSFALRDQCPHIMEELTVEMNDIILPMLKGFYGEITKHAFSVAFELVDNPDILSVLKELRENVVQLLESFLKRNAADVFGVIGHGDFYENNLLFQYQDNVLSNVNILDFLFCRIGSPALDISYYLLTSTDSNIRENYDQLLKIYYESLQTLLLKLGSDPAKLFSFDDLVNQMEKFGKYALIFVPFLLQITLSKPDDIIDLNNIKSEEEMLNPIKLDIKTKQVYKKGILNAVADAKKFGWI